MPNLLAGAPFAIFTGSRVGAARSLRVVTLAAGVIFFSGLQYILLGMFGARVPPLR